MREYRRGDWVVYRKTKHKNRPARRARNVYPSPKGDLYTYDIDKYCRVLRVEEQGNVVLLTRVGGTLTVAVGDPRLRYAFWWERLLRGDRFPSWPPADSVEARA